MSVPDGEQRDEGERRPPGDAEEWFREWFGSDYLALYRHRDEEEAARGVELFRTSVGPPPGARILDLACGAGRHLGPLRRVPWRPVGLDLSPGLARRAARRREGPVVRGDMRELPFRDGTVAGLVSFFTSFGYFESRAEDARVLREGRRVLRAGGGYLLDVLNAHHVRRHLVRRDERETERARIRQRRRIEGEYVVKRIEIVPRGPGEPRSYRERVRLYEPDELAALLEEEGLPPEARFGDYAGAPFRSEAPRLIFVGRAA